MKNHDSPFNRVKRDPATAAPFGWSPDRHLIVSAKELPTLPITQRVMVTRDQIDIVDWVYPLSYISKSWLVWFQQTALRWVKTDNSPQPREWINGIVDAFQAGLAGRL
ncbi:MAG: hypothetical protein NTW21_33305 [Verrucomicrobia bacterium]|nr:hypothetical protein [Verrucomicrobiota bacterium]